MACVTRVDGAIEYIHCDTAYDFLDCLQIRNPMWLPDDSITSPWIFRGQRKAQWSLLPKAMRSETTWFDEFKREKYHDVEQELAKAELKWSEGEFRPGVPILINLILQAAAEWYAVEEFVILADWVGHLLPEDKRLGRGEFDMRVITREILDQSGKQHRSYRFSTEGIEFALAQHHGIPTRLLDWTTMPYAAVFFASQEATQAVKEDGLGYRLAVWALHRSGIDETDLKIVTQKRAKISYLHAQGGLFVYDRMANCHFVHTQKWRSFEQAIEQFQENFDHAVLRKITVPADQIYELLRLLAVENVTRAHLMPTYDNVTETLKMQRLLASRL